MSVKRERLANPFAERLGEALAMARRRRLDALVVMGQKNVLSLAGVDCDNAALVLDVAAGKIGFSTDFRYVPAIRRTAPWLKVRDCHRDLMGDLVAMLKGCARVGRIGYEGDISAAKYLELQRRFPRAKLVDVGEALLELRAVKTLDELTRVARAEALNDRIWSLAKGDFRSGMTEKGLQRIIRAYMNALGDGEAFETIVCVGRNAAECHHVPDDTVWHRGEPLLVDMGVKLDGVMSDMTRCLKPTGATARTADAAEYLKVYDIVLQANLAAIAAARPGMTGAELDAVARRVIKRAGYGKAFGHALGHGVGYEIHESPVASPRSRTVLKSGMLVTIEPGIYLPGRLGVRIEDLVAITDSGCEVLSHSRK